MTDALDFKTFDVADMFAGVSYPKTVVPFYTDAGIAYEFHKLAGEALDAVREKDEEAGREIEERRDALIKKAESNRYEIHLQGQSRDNRDAVLKSVRAKFPVERDFLGREAPNPEADEVYINKFWALHIEKIVRPDGAIITAPDEAAVKVIRGNAPDSEIDKVEAAIQELSSGAKSGFESLAQEHDFLSSASPEA
jgi:hypothetical protein